MKPEIPIWSKDGRRVGIAVVSDEEEQEEHVEEGFEIRDELMKSTGRRPVLLQSRTPTNHFVTALRSDVAGTSLLLTLTDINLKCSRTFREVRSTLRISQKKN